MPVLFQRIIVRSDLHANRNALYLFGDNEERRGMGGQAKEMRGEPNALGVRTKRAPGMNERAFWSDDDYDRCVSMIEEDFGRAFRALWAGKVIVLPSDGIGTGYAELPVRAPRVYKAVVDKIGRLIGAAAQWRQ